MPRVKQQRDASVDPQLGSLRSHMRRRDAPLAYTPHQAATIRDVEVRAGDEADRLESGAWKRLSHAVIMRFRLGQRCSPANHCEKCMLANR